MPKLRILLVGATPQLEASALAFDHPAIVFQSADAAHMSASYEAVGECDVAVVNLDNAGALELVASLSARPNGAPVIGIGTRGQNGFPLEHLLLLAELRGAAMGLPGPFDPVELALVALDLAAVPGPRPVVAELERSYSA